MAANVALQEFEDQAVLRIKFASLRGEGPQFVSDAISEYEGLFDELPAEWSQTEKGAVQTSWGFHQIAWRLSTPDGDVVAVEHETGLEILVISAGLAEKAAKRVSWAWKRWKERREQTKATRAASGTPGEDALVVEQTIWAADGTRTQNRVTVPPTLVSDDLILKYMAGRR
jgi:hypothetical protein